MTLDLFKIILAFFSWTDLIKPTIFLISGGLQVVIMLVLIVIDRFWYGQWCFFPTIGVLYNCQILTKYHQFILIDIESLSPFKPVHRPFNLHIDFGNMGLFNFSNPLYISWFSKGKSEKTIRCLLRVVEVDIFSSPNPKQSQLAPSVLKCWVQIK